MIVKEQRECVEAPRYKKTIKESPTVKKLERTRAQRDVRDKQIELKNKKKGQEPIIT